MGQPRQTTINGFRRCIIGAGQHLVGRGRCQRHGLSMGRDTVYHFVMLTQAGAGIGPFASMVNSLRRLTPAGSGGDPPAGDRRGDGRGAATPSSRWPAHGLSRFPGRAVPLAERAAPQRAR